MRLTITEKPLYLRGFLFSGVSGDRMDRMKRKYTNRRYLDLVEKRVAIFDGAMGTSLQRLDLTAAHFGGERTNGCNDYLVLSYPQAVETVHRSFLEVGVDVIETDTFRSNRLTLSEYGLQDKSFEINRSAAALARRLADEYSRGGQVRFVAGSIGPSGKLPSMDDPELSNIRFDELADIFREQATRFIGRRGRSTLDRDFSGYSGGQSRHCGHPDRLFGNWNPPADSGPGDPGHDRTNAARNRYRRGSGNSGWYADRYRGLELFNRPRLYARADPLSR